MGIESRTVEKEGYKTAFKATALFGGVQVVIILIQILKAKVVALWLGASGLGIMSIFYFELGITGECRPGYRLCQRQRR